MLLGFNLNEILLFPVKDAEARRHFLIGALLSITVFFIPLIPVLLLTGYAVLIARQVMSNESPRMVPWDNWAGMFKDGAKVFAIRIIYSLPIMVLLLPLLIASIALPVFLAGRSDAQVNGSFAVFFVTLAATMCLLFPISLAVALIVPAAEMHAVDKDEFAAGFRIREWWAIFRTNTPGFLAAFGIYLVTSLALTLAFQLLAATVFLACLLPLLLPAMSMYLMLIMFVTIAQAYRDGKARHASTILAAPGA